MENKIPNRGRANYTAISLPKDLMKDVEEYIRNHPRYRSQAEFTKFAIIEKIQKEIVFNDALQKEYSYNISNKNTNFNIQELILKIEKSIKKNHSELNTDINGIYKMLVNITEQLDSRP